MTDTEKQERFDKWVDEAFTVFGFSTKELLGTNQSQEVAHENVKSGRD